MWGDGSRRDTDQLPNPAGSSPTPAGGGFGAAPIAPHTPCITPGFSRSIPKAGGSFAGPPAPNSLILQLQPSHCEYLKPPGPCMGQDFGG